MKKLYRLVALSLLVFAFGFSPSPQKIVVLDISHGGIDAGSEIDGIKEKDLLLKIGKRVQELNQNPNLKVILTRDSDLYLSFDQRTRLINRIQPDYVVSLHLNQSKNEEDKGVEIFVNKQGKASEASQNLAFTLLNGFQNGQAEIRNSSHVILRNVSAPAALVELGYLSNPSEREQLLSAEGQEQLATTLLKIFE